MIAFEKASNDFQFNSLDLVLTVELTVAIWLERDST